MYVRVPVFEYEGYMDVRDDGDVLQRETTKTNEMQKKIYLFVRPMYL